MSKKKKIGVADNDKKRNTVIIERCLKLLEYFRHNTDAEHKTTQIEMRENEIGEYMGNKTSFNKMIKNMATACKRILKIMPTLMSRLFCIIWEEIKMEESKIICCNCETVIDSDDYEEINGEIYCSDCVERIFTTCDCCGSRIMFDDTFGDDYTNLCSYCYHDRYTRCYGCDALIYEDDAYHLNGDDYCRECYEEECDKCIHIHDYGYKPEPHFFGKYSKNGNPRYFGVELEIDGAGRDDDHAEEILETANAEENHIYIKSDGSLDEGMELVSHPHTLEAHKQYCSEILNESRCSGEILSKKLLR